MDPLNLEIERIKTQERVDSLTNEERVKRIVAILNAWITDRARELGEKEPSAEEKAMLLVELIDRHQKPRNYNGPPE